MSSDPLLKLNNVTMKFGGLTAVSDVSFSVNQTDLVAIIGPNGAGKTTLFNTITGIYTPTSGSVVFNLKDLLGVNSSDIADLGIARTFQNIRLFKDLSVLDNIRLAKHTRINYGFWSGIFRTPAYHREEQKIEAECMELLKLFKLEDKFDYLAKNLSYGAQRKLEMARALATGPKLLLLDEPAAGMNPTETKELTELIHFIRDQFKIAIILIEHDMKLVMEIAEKIFVLDYGNLIAEGSPKEIQNNKRVIEAYLGADIEVSV
ncbi:MAG: ABC transporter ATP-binding protein [Bacteriovorax sp.]|jgi:branched-chain amino acid transport system ATP-binding protein